LVKPQLRSAVELNAQTRAFDTNAATARMITLLKPSPGPQALVERHFSFRLWRFKDADQLLSG